MLNSKIDEVYPDDDLEAVDPSVYGGASLFDSEDDYEGDCEDDEDCE